jgi:hypothetical protein
MHLAAVLLLIFGCVTLLYVLIAIEQVSSEIKISNAQTAGQSSHKASATDLRQGREQEQKYD